METSEIKMPAFSTGDSCQKSTDETLAFDDNVLLDLAKRHVAAKRNLIGQVVDFFLLITVLCILIVVYDEWGRFFISVALSAFWGIRLLIRIIKFAKPSFRSGISAYFRERKERKIESEYRRLKKMSTEYIISELNK